MAGLTRILFVGDVELGGEFAGNYCGSTSDCVNPFAETRPLFEQADLTVGNLESPLAQSAAPRNKRNLLHAPPESVRFLGDLGFTSLCLANNHITDHGVEGILRTCALLKRHGIECFGVGKNIETASKPAFNHHGEQTFGFLGYALAGDDVGAVCAGESEEGCAPYSIEAVERDVMAIRSTVSHVIVSIHWGYQHDLLPSPKQVAMARRIINAGALIVHGHHPHVVQGIERYRNGLIMYSLGNFIFPDFQRTDGLLFRFPKETRRTAAVMCEIDEFGVSSHTVYPLRVNSSYRMRPSRGFQRVLDMKALSNRSKVLAADNYAECWKNHHAKTRRVREKQERLLCKRLQLLRLRDKIRAEGFMTALGKMRGRRLGELIQILWGYITALFTLAMR